MSKESDYKAAPSKQDCNPRNMVESAGSGTHAQLILGGGRGAWCSFVSARAERAREWISLPQPAGKMRICNFYWACAATSVSWLLALDRRRSNFSVALLSVPLSSYKVWNLFIQK